MADSPSIFTLNNGLRVVFQSRPHSEVTHCGLMIDVGSRDETESEQGLAHFIEHILFKGTKKRKTFHILSRLDSVGGELNAYTTKEDTCLTASFIGQHLERAIELISDITFNSVFPKRELDKEKDVILDEINSYLDNPSEQIFDDFEEQVFAGHGLGRNILGTTQTVKNIKREDVLQFIKRGYHPEKMVLAVVGNHSLAEVKNISTNYLDITKETQNGMSRKKFENYKVDFKKIKRATHQSHLLMGNIAYNAHHKHKNALILLNNLLGGTGLNSLLNLNLREKYGIAYNIESNYVAYSDTGIFSVYMGVDRKQLEKGKELVLRELNKLKMNKLGSTQLHNAKQQLIGYIALSRENGSNVMFGLAKNLLTYNDVFPIEKTLQKIQQIKGSDLLEVANEIFDQDQMSSLIYH